MILRNEQAYVGPAEGIDTRPNWIWPALLVLLVGAALVVLVRLLRKRPE